MDALPSDLLTSLLSHLPAERVASLATVHRSWLGATEDATLWRALAATAFGAAAASGGTKHCKQLFQTKAWTRANWQSKSPLIRQYVLRRPPELPHSFVPKVLAHSLVADMIAVGSNDGTILLCRVSAPGDRVETLGILRGHTCSVTTVAFSDDGNLLISGAWDKAIRVWDSHTGVCVRQWQAHGRAVMCLMVLRDELTRVPILVSGGGDGRLCFWRNALESLGSADAETPPVRVCTLREDWPVMSLRAADSPAGGSPSTDAQPAIGAIYVDAGYADGSVRRWEYNIDSPVEIELSPAAEDEPPLAPSVTAQIGPLRLQPSTVGVVLLGHRIIEATRDGLRAREREGMARDRLVADSQQAANDVPYLQMSSFGAISCLQADERRIVVAGIATSHNAGIPMNQGGARQAKGAVAVLSPSGELRHQLELSSAAMCALMSDSALLVGCQDGSLTYIDYTTAFAPAPTQSMSLKASNARQAAASRFAVAIGIALIACWVAAFLLDNH